MWLSSTLFWPLVSIFWSVIEPVFITILAWGANIFGMPSGELLVASCQPLTCWSCWICRPADPSIEVGGEHGNGNTFESQGFFCCLKWSLHGTSGFKYYFYSLAYGWALSPFLMHTCVLDHSLRSCDWNSRYSKKKKWEKNHYKQFYYYAEQGSPGFTVPSFKIYSTETYSEFENNQKILLK